MGLAGGRDDTGARGQAFKSARVVIYDDGKWETVCEWLSQSALTQRGECRRGDSGNYVVVVQNYVVGRENYTT
jgi:hypothetical protein